MLDFAQYLDLELDQEPQVEGALLSFDQETQDVVAMVGGSNFAKSVFNRAIQAPRQTGSAFKTIVYASALDKGYTPATPIMDAPIVFEEGGGTDDAEGQGDPKVWKPSNHSKVLVEIFYSAMLCKISEYPDSENHRRRRSSLGHGICKTSWYFQSFESRFHFGFGF